jgi:putative transposase
MGYSFKNVPLELRDTTKWAVPDVQQLDDDLLVRFHDFKNGIIAGLETLSTTEAAKIAKCSRAVIQRQLNRCLTLNEEAGRIHGWFGLWPHARVKRYKRKLPISESSAPNRGKAGVFLAFLELHPQIRIALNNAIGPNEPGKPKGTKHNRREVYKKFKEACKVPSEKITEFDYPFNTKDQGRRSVERYIKKYLESNPGKIGVWYGDNAAKRTKIGTGHPGFPLARQPFDEIAYDAHHLDAIGTIIIPGPAGPKRIAVKRIWVGALCDKNTHVVAGYSAATTVEPSAAMLEEALVRAQKPWKPAQFSIPNLSYLPGAGLPYGAIEGMSPCRPCLITLDNAAQHFSVRVTNKIRRNLGCSLEYGPIGAWWHNSLIERLFGALENYGFHRISSSTGTGPSDPLKKNPVARAIRDGIDQAELLEILDVLFANLNATPIRSMGNDSPLALVAAHLSADPPWLPRPSPPESVFTPKLGISAEFRPVRGSLKAGKAPYVQIDEVEYRSPELSKRYDLIGQNICVHIDEWDMRFTRAYEAKNGSSLGRLAAQGPWSTTKHTRTDRKRINGLRKAGELVLDDGVDPVIVFGQYLTQKIVEESRKRKHPSVSKAATELARWSETTGTRLPVPNTIAVELGKPATGALPPGIPHPNWSSVHRNR